MELLPCLVMTAVVVMVVVVVRYYQPPDVDAELPQVYAHAGAPFELLAPAGEATTLMLHFDVKEYAVGRRWDESLGLTVVLAVEREARQGEAPYSLREEVCLGRGHPVGEAPHSRTIRTVWMPTRNAGTFSATVTLAEVPAGGRLTISGRIVPDEQTEPVTLRLYLR